ncbi:putative meiotic recombination protein dmc1 protein [Neofusicoccum parvum UCRNP2]|uniref:Putative meiotic recombination protein dmc1 protein n=1 Tax=Botryosphaeria parva (strain UCR-NP2) TaxID=1287680 RepID=R1EWJ5_BOTPV|nr:putative meiotic recombination protein dmc1 protein [Neofusicoccum parvum UCRNP2]
MSAATAGGFFPPSEALTPPASSIAASSTSGARLPNPRSKPLKTGGPKESAFIRYVDERIRQIQRRYAKRGSGGDGGGAQEDNGGGSSENVRGYASLKEACRDVDQLVDVVWVSGTPSLQIAYLLTLADLVNEYMKGFAVAPAPLFRSLEKLDYAFASLLQGRDVESGEVLPGFEAVVEVMLKHDPEMDDEEDEEMAGESGADNAADFDLPVDEDFGADDVEGTWDMKTAKVYDKTLVELGDDLTNAPPIGLRVEKPEEMCQPKGADLEDSDRVMELD